MPDGIALMNQAAQRAIEFVGKVYLPDLLAVASYYKEWAGYGAGVGNYLTYGEFPNDNRSNSDNLLLPRGIIAGRELGKVQPVDQQKITEYVTHSWYDYGEGDQKGKHPWEGETSPRYSGPKPPYEFLNTDAKY